MATWSVQLAATAYVKQSHVVHAETRDEAKAKALAAQGEEVWHYDGLDEKAEIVVVTVQAAPNAQET